MNIRNKKGYSVRPLLVLFSSFIIRLFQLIFSAGTVFFSHNISTETVFRLVFFFAKRTGPPGDRERQRKGRNSVSFSCPCAARDPPGDREPCTSWVFGLNRSAARNFSPSLSSVRSRTIFWAVKAYTHHERTSEGADGLVDGHGPAARSRQKNCRFA